ncbi:hypothetical protein COW81_02015 [Candidatus Campbellbacteria bacterium CG22_combo_CG10-13_8_21_14_all_36_13]|uniref:Macrocin O-methyltransferase n=1 Tax=Candidatus Campbellbacteria bacterium CG22_combo_CG10-13_8_21_14_all_36_13 TaxID=1974529 RepID=A0A2H0DZJ5_9BACT|nr:MAG: hypothetical protein COW81_02015 [Candidatus Campbellbacteria bacterium CG22_combo_CG10-13_8_21_14_all_36_13]
MKNFIKKIFKKAGFVVRRRTVDFNLPKMNYEDISQLLFFKRCFDYLGKVDGDVVECGVGQGKSLLSLAFLIKDEMSGRKIWGFDSFEGFPEPSREDQSLRNVKKGDIYSNINSSNIVTFFEIAGMDRLLVKHQVNLIKGFFKNTLTTYRGSQIALLHIDADLYDSYLDVLRELYPKVAKGGIIIFDEYITTADYSKFPGASKAVDEFFGQLKSNIRRDKITGKYYLVKT